MAQVPINSLFGSATAFTLTLASLASSTTGAGRQSTLIDNSTTLYPSAQVNMAVRVGTSAPTANSLIYVYLIRADGSSVADDGAGASDAALTIVNAALLGVILVSAVTTAVTYEKTFDTSFLGELGPSWGIAVVNSSGQTLHATQTIAPTWIGKAAQVG